MQKIRLDKLIAQIMIILACYTIFGTTGLAISLLVFGLVNLI